MYRLSLISLLLLVLLVIILNFSNKVYISSLSLPFTKLGTINSHVLSMRALNPCLFVVLHIFTYQFIYLNTLNPQVAGVFLLTVIGLLQQVVDIY